MDQNAMNSQQMKQMQAMQNNEKQRAQQEYFTVYKLIDKLKK